MYRDSCIDCVAKHVAQAHVLLLESEKGYPLHVYLANGHLAEAEDECSSWPALRELIRAFRTKRQGTFDAIYNVIAEIAETNSTSSGLKTA